MSRTNKPLPVRGRSAQPEVRAPAWTKEALLEEAWAPFGGSIRDDGWYTLSGCRHRWKLLHRGIVLDRNSLVEV